MMGGATAIGDFQFASNRFYANLGARIRKQEQLQNIQVDDEFLYGLGVERPMIKKWDLHGVAEIFGTTSFDNFFSRETALPLELDGLLKKKWFESRLVTFLGAGLGLTQGYGTPLYRVISGVSYRWDLKPTPKAEKPIEAIPAPSEIIELKGEVHFKTASHLLDPTSYPVLDEAAKRILKSPQIEKVQIEGHTDNRGDEKYNQSLSEKRANSVRDYFIQKGISADHLIAIGFGESKPVAENTTAEGMRQNRRVVLIRLK